MARVTLTSLKEENALLRMQNQNLTVENKRLLDIVENSDLVDFDFDYTVAVSIKRVNGATIIQCLPDRSGEIKEFRLWCSNVRHAELAAEFARYKSNAK